jgi:hypothetical protein
MAAESNNYTNHYVVNHKIPYAGPAKIRKIFGKGIKKVWEKADQK